MHGTVRCSRPARRCRRRVASFGGTCAKVTGPQGSEGLFDPCVARIASVDGEVRAVCTSAVEPAHARCCDADQATTLGESWGPLLGLPITTKDAIATEGVRSTGGSMALRDDVPTIDAPAVAALKVAGAIVFGKTNLPEWSGDWQSFNEMFAPPTTRGISRAPPVRVRPYDDAADL